MNDILVTSGLTEGDKARLARLAKWWRQIDLASQAGVTIAEVVNLEKGRYVTAEHKARILRVLGIISDEKDTETTN